MGALRAARRHFAQPVGAEPTELDGGGDGHQGLIGADVGRRLFSTDVLLTRAQGGHEGATIVRINGLTHYPSRQSANEFTGAGKQTEVGAAVGQRRAEGLAFAHEDVGAPLSGRL